MIALDLGITAYTDRYLLARDVTPEWAKVLRAYVARFCAWAHADVPIGSVDSQLVNEWLDHLAGQCMTKWTISNHRCAVVSVWRLAYQLGDNDHPPLRVRTVKRPKLVVEAYTREELRLLLRAAAKLQYKHRDGNSASDFWRAAIHLGYSCAPRRGDLLRLTWSQVSPDGRVMWTQSKTGDVNTARLSDEAKQFAKRLNGSGRILPWPYTLPRFSGHFKRLRDWAGVTRGTFRWIRRSAASFAELHRNGDGSRLLGHRTPGVFDKHYRDRTITDAAPPSPPPL